MQNQLSMKHDICDNICINLTCKICDFQLSLSHSEIPIPTFISAANIPKLTL